MKKIERLKISDEIGFYIKVLFKVFRLAILMCLLAEFSLYVFYSVLLYGVLIVLGGIFKERKNKNYFCYLGTHIFSRSLALFVFILPAFLSVFEGKFLKWNTNVLYPIIIAAFLTLHATFILHANQATLSPVLRKRTRFLYILLFVFTIAICFFAVYLHFNKAYGFFSVYSKNFQFQEIDNLLTVIPRKFKRGFFSLFNSFYYTIAYQTDFWNISRWLFKNVGFYLSELIVGLYAFLFGFFILVKPIDVIVHYIFKEDWQEGELPLN